MTTGSVAARAGATFRKRLHGLPASSETAFSGGDADERADIER